MICPVWHLGLLQHCCPHLLALIASMTCSRPKGSKTWGKSRAHRGTGHAQVVGLYQQAFSSLCIGSITKLNCRQFGSPLVKTELCGCCWLVGSGAGKWAATWQSSEHGAPSPAHLHPFKGNFKKKKTKFWDKISNCHFGVSFSSQNKTKHHPVP